MGWGALERGITPLHPRRGKGERKEGWREWMMHNMLVWRRRRREEEHLMARIRMLKIK